MVDSFDPDGLFEDWNIQLEEEGRLEDELLNKFSESIEPRGKAYLWEPQEGPQTKAFFCEADETLFGGAAGGGKTDLMVGLATSQLSPHKKGIVFRTTYPEHKDFIERMKEVLDDTEGQYKAGNVQKFVNIPRGKSLELGSCSSFAEAQKYRGRPHDLKMFDELSNFPEQVYTFLIGWARSSEPGVPVRVVSASNPPTDKRGEWMIKRWSPWLDPSHPNPAAPGELRWFATLDDNDTEITPDVNEKGARGEPFEYTDKKGRVERVFPKSRTFIPAKLDDNKYLGDEYRSVLQNMPEPLRSQLLYGDFGMSALPDPYQVVPTEWVLASNKRWTELEKDGEIDKLRTANVSYGIDVATTGKDYTCFVKLTGHVLQWIEFMREPDLMKQADEFVIRTGGAKKAPIGIDAIGSGIGLFNRLKQLGYWVAPIDVRRRSKKSDKSGQFKFLNKRAELWWALREALNPENDEPLALPPDRRLNEEITAPRYELTPNGKIKIEKKDEIRQRLLRSPDGAEALIMALYVGKVHQNPLRMV